MKWIVIVISCFVLGCWTIYIPPGPRYPCPEEKNKVYPCLCIQGGDMGVILHCNLTNLASISVAINNLGLPIDHLVLADCRIHRLYGPLFHSVSIRRLTVLDTPVQLIEQDTFYGVNQTLNDIELIRTELEELPVEAFRVLGNVSSINIDNSQITSLPPLAFAPLKELETIRVINSKVMAFHSETFHQLDKLKILDLHGNQISDISKGSFQGLRNLEILDLSYNNMSRLQPTYFADLPKLISINVSNNLLNDYPRGVFARNTVLRVVHLGHNKIKKLDVNSFRGMRFLRRIYLNDNEINDVGRGTFGSVSRIGTIDLARNRLKTVDFQMFHELSLCEHINVAENQITEIQKSAFKDIYLAKVNLSWNQINTVEAGSFINCVNLTVLDLSHNKLNRIPRTAFDSTTYPHELRLEYNEFTNLSWIPFDNMTGIQILNVSYNQLQVIPRKTFPKLYELHTIDLSHNNLQDIDGSVFPNLFSVRHLNLSYNNLSSLTGSTLGNIPTLLDLDLSFNQLKDVARSAFARLPSLRSLNMKWNRLESIFQLPISLIELNLQGNRISKIPANRVWPVMNALLILNLNSNQLEDRLEPGSFANLLSLQSLDLGNNSISIIPWQAFADLTSLQYIYLDHNRLTELGRSAFGRLPVVFHLQLSHNAISNISEKAFEGLLQLLHLNLSSNGLHYIPPEAFFGLVSMRTLDLSYNHIERLDNKTHSLLADCLSLERVNLSHNEMSFITTKTFPESPWIPYRLSEIDLSYNRIPVITKEILTGTKKVTKLSLKGNILNEIRPGVLPNFTNLEELDLSNNELTHINKGFLGPIKNLTRLDLSSNLMVDIPIEDIVQSTKLAFVNLKGNRLVRFYDEFMSLIEMNGTQVDMRDNPIVCDCRLRPLLLWMSTQKDPGFWESVICTEPANLAGLSVTNISEESLTCSRQDDSHLKTKYSIVKDIVMRDASSDQKSIHYSWYVQTRDDVGDFFVEIRSLHQQSQQPDLVSNPILQKAVGYGIRHDTIENIDQPNKYAVCIRARTTTGNLRPWKPNQCQPISSRSSLSYQLDYWLFIYSFIIPSVVHLFF